MIILAYDNWTIDDITVPHVRSYKHDKNSRTITLNCSALIENTTPLDVRTEIEGFEAIACDTINNTQLIQGGSCLEVCNCDPVLVSDGEDAWVGALLQPVVNEHKTSHKRLDYDLIIIYETVGMNINYAVDPEATEDETPLSSDLGSKRYYNNCFPGIGATVPDNLIYWQYTDTSETDGASGTGIGKVTITETRNVKQVKISGCGYVYPAWIEVNGVRQNWIQYTLNNPDCGYSNPIGFEVLTFDITPSMVVSIQTSTRIKGGAKCDDHGSYISYIEVVFE